jgi:hypothetical protein
MQSLADRDKQIARTKGLYAAGATAGAVATIALVSTTLGVIALVPAGLLVRDWFRFRARRGMRF